MHSEGCKSVKIPATTFIFSLFSLALQCARLLWSECFIFSLLIPPQNKCVEILTSRWWIWWWRLGRWWVSVLVKEAQRRAFALSTWEGTDRSKCVWGSGPSHQICGHLDLELPRPIPARNNFLLFIRHYFLIFFNASQINQAILNAILCKQRIEE